MKPSPILSLLLAFTAAHEPAANDSHDPDRRVRELGKKIESDPKNPRLYLLRAELYRQNRRFSRAHIDLDRVVRLDPRLAGADLVRGQVFFDQKRFDAGLAAVERFLNKALGNVHGLRLRGRLRMRTNDPRAAARDFAAATTGTAVPRPDDFLEWARALVAASESRAAVRVIDAGIARLGPLVSLHSCALDLEEAAGRTEAALARLAVLAAGARRKERWHYRRGRVLVRAGRRDEALGAFRAASAAIAGLPRRCRVAPATKDLAGRICVAIEGLTK